MSVLRGVGLGRRYGSGQTAVEALAGVDVEVRAGRLTVVRGPSGSGKTTLLNLLGGLDRPTSGRVLLGGLGLSYKDPSSGAPLLDGVDVAFRARRITAVLDPSGLRSRASGRTRLWSLGRHTIWLRREHRAVHGHRHRHLVQRDAVEQLPHVQDGVDGHAGHADVTGHARVVGVVAAVGGQVEGDRQALLAGREVAAVEGVRLLGGGETKKNGSVDDKLKAHSKK